MAMIMVLLVKMIVMVIVGRSQLHASISDMWHEGRKCPEWHISPRAPHSVKFWHILYSTAQSVKFVQGSDWRYHLPRNWHKRTFLACARIDPASFSVGLPLVCFQIRGAKEELISVQFLENILSLTFLVEIQRLAPLAFWMCWKPFSVTSVSPIYF